MQRRNFFRNSALYAGTALAAAQNLSFGAGEFSGVLKKGIKFSNVREPNLSIADRMKLLRDLGFDGAELHLADCENYAEFRAAAEQTDFKIHGIIASINPDLETALNFAADVGADSVSYTARYDKKKPLMESWQQSQLVIREALPISEKHQVKILIENSWSSFLISALDMQRYIDEIAHPNLEVCFDVGNNAGWGVPPEHWVEILGSRVAKLHIKDWDEGRHRSEGLRAGLQTNLGEGSINWAEVRSALKRHEFSGWATASIPGGDRMRLLDISQRMDSVLGLV